jgi:hypothetical protein
LSGTISATVDGYFGDVTVGWVSVYNGTTELGDTNVSSGTWTIDIPSVTGTLTFKANIRTGDNQYYYYVDVTSAQPVTVTSADTEKTGIVLTAAVTPVRLSGTLNINVGGETITSVLIEASTTDTNGYLGTVEYSSLPIPTTWELSIPSSATARTVNLSVGVTTDSDESYYSATLKTVSVPAGQEVPNIALTAQLVTVSGTFGTVSIDGNPPSAIMLAAFDASTNGISNLGSWDWDSDDSTYSNNMAWSLPILTSGNSITLKYVVQIRDEDSTVLVYKPATTTSITNSNIPGIQLGDIALTTKNVSGTIAGLDGSIEAYIVSEPISKISDLTVSDMIAYLEAKSNILTFKIPETVSTFYVLAMHSDDIKISGPLTGTSFNINWAAMTTVQYDYY